MKLTLIGSCVAVCFCLAAGAQTDFANAVKAGTRKLKARYPDAAGARADFSRALELAETANQTARAIAGVADSFYVGRDPEKGRAEDAKILAMTDISPGLKVDAQLRIAESFMGYRFPAAPDYAAARAEYRKVLTMPGASADQGVKAMFGLAGAFAVDKMYAEARAEYAKVLATEDATLEQKLEARYSIGSNYRAEGDFENARAEFAKILQMQGVSPEFREVVEERLRTIYR